MKKRYLVALAVAVAAGPLYGLAPTGSARAAGGPVSFKADVQPIFQKNCVSCHTPGGEGTTASGLDLTSYEGVMRGTKYGPMIVPGDPDYSNLMWLLDWHASPQLRMPHNKSQLPAADRDVIRNWIRQGAKNN
jgi:mono/diheme cytochrome c family protein